VVEATLCPLLALSGRPVPVALVHWVVTGRWPDPDIRVDIAFPAPGATPLL